MNKDKVAIVTGASRGIGKAITIKLMQLGYNVIGIYRSHDDLASKLKKQYPKLTMIKGDVADEKFVLKVIDTANQKYQRIDAVVNNVGINLFGKIENYKTENWDKMINTNLKSAFLFSKYSIDYLKKSDNPVIINISSRIGFPEFSEPEFIVYGITKSALNYFTVALSKELKETNIRVNAVIPTPTKTDLFDEVFTKEDEDFLKNKDKLGKPEDVADLVTELIQDKKSNGKILVDKRVNL
jgi:3-oxoacyl-[acyl-carrier protein] reductase